MSNKTYSEFKLAPVAAALLLAFGSAQAQQSAEVQALVSPESTVSVGVGVVNTARDAKRFGQYTGLNKDASALVDFEWIKRDEATGTWTTLTGRNLGLDTRELGFGQQKQGDWKYNLDYNEIVRNDPYVINTGMTGIGSTSPQINLIATPAGVGTSNSTGSNAGVYLGTNPNGLVTPISPAQANEVELKLKRTAFGASGEKWISPELQLELNFKNEEKKGARLFGRVGLTSGDIKYSPVKTTGVVGEVGGGGALLLTPEPIDSVIRTIDAKLNFNRGNLALTGGYYGSFYINNNGSLTPIVPGTLNRGALWTSGASSSGCLDGTAACTIQQNASSAVALPPDNQAHQLYASGTYAYSDTTRTNFKLSYTHATQNENFAGMGLNPGTAPVDLGGVVDSTLAQVGLTMRPIKDLSVNASLRYEDRNDKTPIAVYNTNGISTVNPTTGAVNALYNTTNWGSGSQTRTTGKVDGIYRFSAGYTANVGMDWERKVTPLPIVNTGLFSGQVYFRPSLDEYGVHAGLRKAMSETLNGAISLELKQRRGDDNAWVTASGLANNPLKAFDPALTNNVLPNLYMDRDRSKVRGSLDWTATDKLTLEVTVEHGQDDFKRIYPATLASTAFEGGARVISNDSVTLDGSYFLSDDWRLNGYFTRSENRWNANKAAVGDDTKNATNTVGFSIKGKLAPKLNVGMDLLAADDVTSFTNNTTNGLPTLAANILPNINYNTRKLNLFGIYDVDKKSAIKVNLVYQEFKTDDWQWGYNGVPFLYSDNTTVSNPNQTLTFLGVAYLYKF